MRYLSLFSGMEAAHLAWSPLGWECVGVAEIDPAPCALLRHRLPNVPNLGSVTDITDDQIAALGRIDVLIGGSPCQDLSVAGKRAGLTGARSSLFHHQLRIFNAARHLCGARWLVWENVPGAFSSNAGRDFAVVVGAMAGCDLPVPADGWGGEGAALGDNGLVEWSVLDAQWFGVAQRRRRVFAVLDTGNWSDRPPVLFESDSLRGHSAPSREAREGVTGTLSARTSGGGGLGTDFECQGGLVPDTCGTLCADTHPGAYTGQDAYTGRLIPALARCDTTGEGTRQDWETCTIFPAVAFDCKAAGDTSHSIGDVPDTLRAQHGGGHAAIAYTTKLHNTSSNNAGKLFEERTTCLDANSPAPALLTPNQVRRLTPRECERLQGAPDDWTLVPNAQGKPMADGPRYKMLGNSFAVPVIAWIGKQISAAQEFA